MELYIFWDVLFLANLIAFFFLLPGLSVGANVGYGFAMFCLTMVTIAVNLLCNRTLAWLFLGDAD